MFHPQQKGTVKLCITQPEGRNQHTYVHPLYCGGISRVYLKGIRNKMQKYFHLIFLLVFIAINILPQIHIKILNAIFQVLAGNELCGR